MRTRRSTPVRVGEPPSFCRAGRARQGQLVFVEGAAHLLQGQNRCALLFEGRDCDLYAMRGRARVAGPQGCQPRLAVGNMVALSAPRCPTARSLSPCRAV